MALELNDLRYFLEVRQKGSLTSAAKALGITQPSLTAAMQRLEKHYGTTLLLRDRTGVRLTVTGRALAHDATEVFEVLSRAERRVLGLEDQEAGRFVIGSHESLAAYFLPDLLRRFFGEHPTIEIAIFNASSAAVADAVVDRAVDFGLVVNPKPHPDLVLIELFDDAVDFFALSSSPRSDSLDDALARIEEGPLVHAARVSESQQLMARLEALGATPRRVIACGDFELVKSIALAGVGVSVLPRRVAAYGHPGKLVRVHPELPCFEDRIHLVYRGDMHKTKAALAVKDALAAQGKRMRDGGGSAASPAKQAIKQPRR